MDMQYAVHCIMLDWLINVFVTETGMMQARNFTLGLVVVTFFVICICLHLLAELSQLDGARRKLGENWEGGEDGDDGDDMVVVYYNGLSLDYIIFCSLDQLMMVMIWWLCINGWSLDYKYNLLFSCLTGQEVIKSVCLKRFYKGYPNPIYSR